MIRDVLRSRRSSIFFMVGVLVIAGLLAVKVIFFPEQAREATAPSASASAGSVAPSVAVSAGSVGADGRAVCDVKVPAGKEFSAEVPDDYVWDQTAAGIHYPVSATYGPTVRQGRLGQCFAHNPTGAAMAAINTAIVLGNSEVSNESRRAILSSRFANQPDAWTSNGDTARIEGAAAIYAYSIQGYSTERATVKIYIMAQKPGGSINIGWLPVRVVWEDGDWRLDSERSEMKTEVMTDEPSQRFLIDQSEMTAWGFSR